MNEPEIMPFGKKGLYEENTGTGQKKYPLHKRILLIIVALLGVELINSALWQAGAISACMSIFVSEIVTGVTAFLAGRIYERFCR